MKNKKKILQRIVKLCSKIFIVFHEYHMMFHSQTIGLDFNKMKYF